ncbi:MAG: sulfur oxidation c-type cytochrome SoxX [Methylobacterium sp.]|nr:sulfur oxidation c-type cytochrome SoxX [Methylobacterium sp.]
MRRGAGAFGLAAMLVLPAAAQGPVAGKAMEHGAVPEAAPLPTSRPADAANGRKIVVERRRGFCLLCHSGPFPEARFHGDLAPSLAGTGSRWTEGQLRARLIDSTAINAETIMPPYFRTGGGNRIGPAFVGKPILTAEEIEDVTAFLTTLRD